MNIDLFIQSFGRVKRTPNGFTVKCPAHTDRIPSLAVSEGAQGRILIHCFSGCSTDNILDAMGLKRADLFPGDLSLKGRREYAVRKAKQEVAATIGNSAAVIFRKSEAIVRAATGVDISAWTESQHDKAMNILAEAYKVLWVEELKELNRG